MIKLWKYDLKNPGNSNSTTFVIPDEIKDTLWPEAYKAAKDGQAPPPTSDSFEIEDSDFTRKLLKQPDNSQVYVSQFFTNEQIVELLTGNNCYYLARDLAAEFYGIGYKDINTFENSLKSHISKIKNDGYEPSELKEWLKEAKRPFLDTLLASLDASSDLIETPSVSKKRKELAKLVADDTEKVAWIKYYYTEFKNGQVDFEYAKDELEDIKEQYTVARTAVKEAKESLEGTLDTVVKCCIYSLDDSQQEIIKNKDAKIDREKARKERQRIRFKGLLEYSKGVAAATIDGLAPQYINAAQEVGNQIMKASDNIIASHSTEGVEYQSMEQTEIVVKAIPDIAKTLIQDYASERALNNALSRSLSKSPETNLEHNSQTVKVSQS